MESFRAAIVKVGALVSESIVAAKEGDDERAYARLNEAIKLYRESGLGTPEILEAVALRVEARINNRFGADATAADEVDEEKLALRAENKHLRAERDALKLLALDVSDEKP